MTAALGDQFWTASLSLSLSLSLTHTHINTHTVLHKLSLAFDQKVAP